MRGSLAAGCLLLGACADTYVASNQAVTLPTALSGPATGTDIVLLRAYYYTGVAFAEINTASCVVTAGAAAVTVTPPVNLAVPRNDGALPEIEAHCTATIGGSSLSGRNALTPRSETGGPRYADILDVQFRRSRAEN